MQLPVPKKILSALAVFAGCVFVIIYMYRQIAGVRQTVLATETALAVSVENSTSATGFIMRDETVIKGTDVGTVFSVIQDGKKVASGKAIANVYDNVADLEAQSRIEKIDEKLKILEKSTVDQEYFSADVGKLEKDKNEILKNIIKSKAQNQLSDCVSEKNALLVSMNKLSTVKTGTSFESQINLLKDKKKALASGGAALYSRIYTPSSGIYYSTCDGYENIFRTELLDDMTLESFTSLTSAQPDSSVISDNAGKLVTKSRWFLLCSLPKENSAGFEKGRSYDIVFPYSADIELKMELYNVISETDKNQNVLIFSSDKIPESFNFLRAQPVQIVSTSISGLKVPKSAMRVLSDGTKGVYVLSGETVRFRLAEEIYSGDDFYIIRTTNDSEKAESAADGTEAENDTTYRYLELYDNVIVGGKELYDGKRIN